MSGIEIFGIGASVLQIADLGTRVSVKLFGFARKIRGAAEKIDLISKEIAATGALLQQLSEQLDKDSKTQLLRRELVDSANELVQECNKIFKNIDKAIDGTSGNKIILSLKQKVHYAYLESEIEALRMNLENLKSSICIMQNILIYAEQLRNRERLPVLKEQQDLLKALNEEKLANEQRYNKLMRAIKQSPDSPPATSFHAGFASAQFSAVHVPVGSSSEQFAAKNIQCTQSPSPQQPHMHNIDQREWHDYNTLMSQILKEVHSNNYNLKSEIRRRLQDGVLEVHWQEWATFRKSLGDDALLGMLYNLPELRKFWLMKIEKQRATHFMLQNVSSDKPVVERPRDHIDISHRFDPDTEKARTRFELLKQQEGVKKLREAHELQLKRKEEEGVLSRKGGASACFRVRQQQRVEGHGYVDERPRLTYTRVEKKHLSEDTLNFYQLPWEMDQRDPKYLVIKQFVDNDMMEQLFQNTRERRSRVSEGPGTGMGSSLSASSAYTPTGHPPQDIKLEGEEYYKLKLADVGNPTRRAVFLKGQTRSFKSDTVRIGRFDSNQPEIAQEVAHSALTSTSQSEAGDDILESARMPYELEKMVRSSEYYPARRVESPDPGSSSTSTTVVRTRKAYTMKDLPMKTEHLCMMSGPVDSDDVLEDWDIAEPEPKHFDIQSLLSQWTTLSAKEIARGNDPSR